MITSLIWLPASLTAGLFQAWRTALQQRLRAELSVSGAGLVRYLYGAPVAVALLIAYAKTHEFTAPHLSAMFFVFAAVGGLTQIVGTNLLIAAFSYRNFVVGTAFSKTEAMQAALFAWLVFGERLGAIVLLGIGLGVVGVLALSLGGRQLSVKDLAKAIKQPAALCGLGAGALFALTGVFVKRATIEFAQPDAVLSALVTLAIVMTMQTAMHGTYIAWREPQTLKQAIATWRTSSQVGLFAALGSACWFIGFATAPVALVRIVGQIEVVFTLLFARVYLREHTKRHEIFGLLLVAAGVVLALIGSVVTI